MTAPGPWHEVEVDVVRIRWREHPDLPLGFEVERRWNGRWNPVRAGTLTAFALGYHARRELVATLVAQEQHGGGS